MYNVGIRGYSTNKTEVSQFDQRGYKPNSFYISFLAGKILDHIVCLVDSICLFFVSSNFKKKLGPFKAIRHIHDPILFFPVKETM